MKKNINKILIAFLMIFILSVSTLTIVEAKSSKSAVTAKTKSKKGKNVKKIEIPDFNNVPVIKDWCKENKLKLKTKYKYSDTVEKGKIISQKPKVGKKVKKNTKVNVVISKGRKPTMEEKNALKKAKQYSSMMYMSKASIYDQLTSEYGEGFTAEAAQYAIDNLVADYNGNALKKAKEYQKTMSMSRNQIYEQLTSEYGEKFTAEEAQYALDHLPQ